MTDAAEPAEGGTRGLARAFSFRGATGPLIGLILLCVVLSLATDRFLSVRNLLNILDQITVLGIMAVGMTFVILIGGIDLAVGSVLALGMMVMGYLANEAGLPMALAILLSLVAAAATGLISGVLVTSFGVPAFIATLTMTSVARGVANTTTDGQQIVGIPDRLSAVTGADLAASGAVRRNGRPLPPQLPEEATLLIPEDRKLQGLVVEHGIGENMGYANLDRIAPRGWVRGKALSAFADDLVGRFGVKGRAHQPASSLSGGNQQKVVIAKWLARDPKVVVLDEPTRGIDVGARSSIYDVIVGLAARGVAVVVVSSDLEEVMGVSNRILVLAKGRQAGILDRPDVSDVNIMELATS